MEKAKKIGLSIFWFFVAAVAWPAIAYIVGDKLGSWVAEKIMNIWEKTDDICETIADVAEDVVEDWTDD